MTDRRSRLSQGVSEMTKRNADHLVDLPDPDTAWPLEEQPISQSTVLKFVHNGLIRRVEREQRNPTASDWGWRWTYRVRPEVYRYAEDVVENRTDTMCPCGHPGIVNLGDEYTCAYDHCDATYARSEVNA